VCVLPHEFSLVHLHGFLTALPRPDSELPRPYQCCLGLEKTASPTSLAMQSSRLFKCVFDSSKKSFYNLQLLTLKICLKVICLPVLLYGLNACYLSAYNIQQISWLRHLQNACKHIRYLIQPSIFHSVASNVKHEIKALRLK